MGKQVLLLDVDGVLLNGESFAIELEKDYGISYEMLQPFFKGPFLQSSVGQADMRDIIAPYLQEWNWPGSFEDFITYWFKAEHKVDQTLVDYVSELKSKGVRCYLATNQEQYRTKYILENIGFNDSFDGVFVSYQLGVAKPDIKFFEELYKQLEGVSKDEILFWDDTLANIETAKQFGIAAEHYTDFASFKTIMESKYA